MPKIVSEEKKKIARMRIKEKTEDLIDQIGIRNVTITKICDTVPIGKGTFYYYYDSKEILFYEIIKKKEENIMKQILRFSTNKTSVEKKVIDALTEVYIGKGNRVNKITSEEIELILEKLPPELLHKKELRGKNFFEDSMKLLGVNPQKINMNVLGELLDSINSMASSSCKHGEDVKREALQVMIRGLATYISQKVSSDVKGGK